VNIRAAKADALSFTREWQNPGPVSRDSFQSSFDLGVMDPIFYTPVLADPGGEGLRGGLA
jgi:hypothetical protein